jgi:restriction system protein
MSDDTYHYPPELLSLLIETIPLLCKSKVDVLTFFRGCAVPPILMADLRTRVETDRASINKYEITRVTLTRLNEGGDGTLGHRREVIKRVTEFEDFSACWDSDRLKAQGLVGQVRQVVKVKDSFTRMRQERDAERQDRLRRQREEAEAKQRRREEGESLRRRLAGLSSMTNPQQRGKAFEGVFNDLFKLDGMSVRDAFTITDDEGQVTEQIDGIIALGSQDILAEVKWYAKPLGVEEVSRHMVRVFTRTGVYGLIVSASGFTGPAIEQVKQSLPKMVVVLAEVHELLLLLEEPKASLSAWLEAKVRAATVDRNPLFRPALEAAPQAS